MKFIAFSTTKYSVTKSLRADADWFADLFDTLAKTMSAAQADALAAMRELRAEVQRRERAAAALHQLRAYLDAPGRASCSQVRFLLSPASLEWARRSSGTSTSRHDCICTSDTGTNARDSIPGTWTALVAYHRADLAGTGSLSAAAVPTVGRARSGTAPCDLYNDDDARWTMRLHTIAPHTRALPGHMPWHIQTPAGLQSADLPDQCHSLTSACTCALPDHCDSTTLLGRARDLAGITNRRLLHDHHLDIPSGVTSEALLDQLCPQCLHDTLAPPHETEDSGRPAGDPAFVLITWIPHNHTDTDGEHEPRDQAEQPALARPPAEHTEPEPDAWLDTLQILGKPSAPRTIRAVLTTLELLGNTSLGTARARTTRHAGSVSATADIINRYNDKVRRHNQQRRSGRHIAETDIGSDMDTNHD